ncbi:MAG: hypothetical protein J5602_12930, partial [Clostridia bacterium]|nr:hypothetical protein [Clostridia bacterium]
MKRLYLLLICLLLALCLTGVARAEMTEEPIEIEEPEPAEPSEEPPMPALELDLRFTEKMFALAPVCTENGLPRIGDATLIYASIRDYDELAYELYGQPEWSLIQTGGEESGLVGTVEDLGDSFCLYMDETPNVAEDVTFVVICQWDGLVASEEVVIHFVEKELPTETNIPDRIYMQVGDVLPLDYHFVSGEWDGVGYAYLEYYVNSASDYVETTYVDDALALYAVQPGVAMWLELSVRDDTYNLALWKKVAVFVADENGVVPGAELELEVYSGGEEQTWALAPKYADDGAAHQHTNLLAGVCIPNYGVLSAILEGSPVWSMTQTGGEALSLNDSYSTNWYDAYLNEVPTAAGDYTFEITCEWGEKSATKTVTIHYVDMELPTGSTIPDTLGMQVGEIVLMDYDFVPANWGNSTIWDMWFINDAYEYLEIGWDEDEGKDTLTAIQAGIARIGVEVYDYDLNVIIYKTVTVLIADENGVVPGTELELYVNGGEEKTWALAPDYAENGMARRFNDWVIDV